MIFFSFKQIDRMRNSALKASDRCRLSEPDFPYE